MPFPGAWITPPVQSTFASMGQPGLTLTSFESSSFVSDAHAYAGSDSLTETEPASSHDSRLVPFASGAADVVVYLWMLIAEELRLNDYVPTLPPGASSWEYEPVDSTLLWPIAIVADPSSAIDFQDTFSLASAPDPGDASMVLKRLTAGDYSDSGGPSSTVFAGTWPTWPMLAARTTVMTAAPDGTATPTSLSFNEADLDDLISSHVAVFWEGFNYYADNRVPPCKFLGGLVLRANYSYQPRRYRFLYDFRPPLAHRQRRDGAATAGPQLAHLGTAGGRPPLAWRQNNP